MVSSYKTPERNISGYRTFSVFPQSLFEKTEMNEILEKQMLFFLRNHLEAKGYKFVELNEQPDFLATINASAKYETSYVPPETVTQRQRVLGQTITTYGTSSGTFNYSTYGSFSSYGWGNYSGLSTSTTYVPGYITTQTYTRPGHTIGHYYPVAGISVYDGKTLERVWFGTGAGISGNADVRVSSQFVVDYILDELPDAAVPYDQQPSDGVLGMGVKIFTNDGNNYVPTITAVAQNSPAQKVGLRAFDMILAVDNVSVVNKPLRAVLKLIAGRPGSIARLEVWRVGQRLAVDVTRTSRQNIQW